MEKGRDVCVYIEEKSVFLFFSFDALDLKVCDDIGVKFVEFVTLLQLRTLNQF